MEGSMASSYHNITVSPLFHFSKVLSNQFPQYSIWPFSLVPMISLYAENSLRKHNGFTFGLNEKDIVKREKNLVILIICYTMKQVRVRSKGCCHHDASAPQSLRSLWVLLWRQQSRMPTVLSCTFPQKAFNPKTKKAELPLIRKLYKFLFSTPLLTKLVSHLSDKTAEMWFLGMPSHPFLAWGAAGWRDAVMGAGWGGGGGVWVSIFDGTILSKVNSNTACSRLLC